MRSATVFLTLGTAIVMAAPLRAAADASCWPMFRGAQNLTGVAQGRLPDSLELLWTFKSQGPVKSSAAIAEGRVFVGSDDGRVYCIDLGTGKEVWSFKTEGAVEACPLVTESAVYVGSSDFHLYALDPKTGGLKWKCQTNGKIVGSANVGVPRDGMCTWKTKSPSVLFGSYDNKLYCVDGGTGKVAWTFETTSYVNGAPSVAIAGGKATKVVFGGCDGKLHALDVNDGKQLVEVEIGSYVAGSAAVVGDRAFMGHYGNEVVCVDIKSGEIAWRFKDRAFPYFSSPAVTEKVVLIGGRDKRLHCLDREKGTQLWEFTTGGDVDSSPVVCGDKVVFGSSDGKLYMLNLNTGKEVWSYEIGAGITASPAVAAGTIIVGALDGSIYAFGAKQK